jgi:hypothetical protein
MNARLRAATNRATLRQAETNLQNFVASEQRAKMHRHWSKKMNDAKHPAAPMMAVILCGGRGAASKRHRTQAKTDDPHWRRANPLVRDFVLCLGYKGSVIRDYFLKFRTNSNNFRIDLADGRVTPFSLTTLRTGGCHSLNRARRHLPAHACALPAITSSAITSLRLTAMAFRRRHRAKARFPSGARQSRHRQPDRPDLVLETDVRADLSAQGQSSFQHSGYWQCMDTMQELEDLNRIWNAGTPPWKIW